MIEKVCEECGTIFMIKPSKKLLAKFCSRQCMNARKTKTHTIHKPCAYCNKMFVCNKSRERNWCSNKCCALSKEKVFTAKEETHIMSLYSDKISAAKIAKLYQCATRTIYKVLDKYKVPRNVQYLCGFSRKPRKDLMLLKKEMAELYESGASTTEIASKYNTNHTTVLNYIRDITNIRSGPEFIDESGNQYGAWTVISYSHHSKTNGSIFNCVCSCGREMKHSSHTLRKGNSTQCGKCFGKSLQKQSKIDRFGREVTKCCKCNRWKPFNKFNKAKGNQFDLASMCRACVKKRHQERCVSDIQYKMRYKLRTMLKNLLRLAKREKEKRTTEYVTYTHEELRTHIESLWKQGMTWENTKEWHIHHIRPCSSFDLTDDNQIKECMALNNLTPLWAQEHYDLHTKYGGTRNSHKYKEII